MTVPGISYQNVMADLSRACAPPEACKREKAQICDEIESELSIRQPIPLL